MSPKLQAMKDWLVQYAATHEPNPEYEYYIEGEDETDGTDPADFMSF